MQFFILKSGGNSVSPSSVLFLVNDFHTHLSASQKPGLVASAHLNVFPASAALNGAQLVGIEQTRAETWFCYRVAECPRSKRVRFGNEAHRRLTSLTEYLEAPNPQTLSRVCWALLLAKTKSWLWIVTLIFLSVCYFPANEGMILPGYLCGTTTLENGYPEKD